MSSSEIPSKEAIRADLQRRLDSVREQLTGFDALRQECRELEAALAALEGTGTGGGKAPAPRELKRKRGTREQVQARRDRIAKMLDEDSNLSINDVAQAVDVSYQTAANDIKLLRSSGHSF